MRSPVVMRMKYRRIRPAAYAISLCPFSSSTSNIAFGSAWETTASRTTASSFWTSPSVVGRRDRDGRRGPLRGVELLANSRRSLASFQADLPAECQHTLQAPPGAGQDRRQDERGEAGQGRRAVREVAV